MIHLCIAVLVTQPRSILQHLITRPFRARVSSTCTVVSTGRRSGPEMTLTNYFRKDDNTIR